MPQAGVPHDDSELDHRASDAEAHNDEAPLLERQQYASTSFDVEQADEGSLKHPRRMLHEFRTESVR